LTLAFESEEMGNESHGWERYGGYTSLILLLLILVGGALFYLRLPRPTPIEIIEPTPTPASTPAEIGVYVVGAVMNPGVYFLPQGSRVADALEAAGGPTEEPGAQSTPSWGGDLFDPSFPARDEPSTGHHLRGRKHVRPSGPRDVGQTLEPYHLAHR
jgi:hypothetical protein